MEAKEAYDLVAEQYAQLIPDTAYESELDLAMVRLFVELLGGARVLDAGCGTGRMSAYLRSLDPTLAITGLDLSPEMLRQARLVVPAGFTVHTRLERGPRADLERSPQGFVLARVA